MKRYLLYIVIISLGTLLFAGPPIRQTAQAATDNSQVALSKSVPAPTTQAATTTTQPAQAVPATPVATAPVFNANDPTTWPKCASGQIVWAQDGQCHNTTTASSSASAPVVASIASTAAVGGCGDNYYASYIYAHESGGQVLGNCSPTEYNAEGCLGIGQACPASKLLAVCPDESYTCENAYFTQYAQKYGGWEGAYEFWLGHGWW